jgi:hypothetical protein
MTITFLLSSASVNENKSESTPTIKHSLRRNANLTRVVVFTTQSGEMTPKTYGSSKFAKKKQEEKVLLLRAKSIIYAKKKMAKNADKTKYDEALSTVTRKLNFEPHSGLFDNECLQEDKLSCLDVIDTLPQWYLNSFYNQYQDVSDSCKKEYQRVYNTYFSGKINLSDDDNGIFNFQFDILTRISEFSNLCKKMLYCNEDNIDCWVAYLTAISTSTNMTNFVSVTYLFFREQGMTSCWKIVKDMFKKHSFKFRFQNGVETNDLDDSSESEFNHEDFLKMLKGKFSGFKHMKNSKAFGICSKILLLITSNMLCTSSLIKFNMCGFNVFSESLIKRILHSTKNSVSDIFELAIESVEYFLEVGYLCFKYKSFRPLLFDNHEQLLHAEMHVKFLSSWTSVKELDWINSGFRDEVEYREEAIKLIEFYKKQYSSLKLLNSHEGEIIKRKWEVIETKLKEMVRLSMCGRLRKSPFAICIHGGSSVGKSSISQILTTSAVIAQGGNPSPEYATVYNPNDNFFSTYKFGTEAILLDDMCNTKPDFVKNSPVEKIIEFVNNIASYPVMADLASKGKIPLEPKVVTVTTNVADLLAGVYSMEPVSIMRRFNLFVTVEVKECFARNPGVSAQHRQLCPTLARKFTDSIISNDPLDIIFADLWDIYCFTIESGGMEGVATVVKKPVKVDNKGFCVPMSIREVHELVCQMAHKHSNDQQLVVKRISDLPRALSDAYVEKYPHNRTSYDQKFQSGILQSLLPVVSTSKFNNYFICLPFIFIVSQFLFALALFILYFRRILNLYNTYKRNKLSLDFALNNPRLSIISLTGFTVGFSYWFVLLVKWVLTSAINKMKKSYFSQGNLTPLSVEELNINSTSTNTWVKRNVEPIVVEGCKTMIDVQLKRKVEKNMIIVIAESGINVGKSHYVNGFMVQNNFCLIPNHFFKLMIENKVQFLKLRSSRTSEYEDRIQRMHFNKNHYYHFQDTDLGLLYVTYGVPVNNLIKFIPEDIQERRIPAEMVYLTNDGVRNTATALLHFGEQKISSLDGTNKLVYEGYSYKLDNNINTFNGMCMGTWISNTKPTAIVGFHLGGSSGTPMGCSGFISAQNIRGAIKLLSICNIDVVEISSQGSFDPHFGETHVKHMNPRLSEDIKPDHPMLYTPNNSYLINYGSISGTHKYRTKVCERKYAKEFFEVLGKTIEYGPPNMNGPPKWFHFSKNLFKFAEPGIGPKSEILKRAVNDYLLPLKKVYTEFNASGLLLNRPLTNDEILNGIHNMRFIDAMKATSSMGFPLSGKLSDYIEGPDGHKVFKSEAQFFWKRVEDMENNYLLGKRSHPVFTSHLKDEPKKIGSEKVRVFFGASTDFKLIIRKYFLPIVRLLSELPIISECAVGIDCHSPQWGEFMNHVTTHGDDRIVAGDYSGYDQQLPLNVTQASMNILVVLAECLGYSESSLKIMRGIISDITTPTVNFYGSLMTLMGGNPSGQNLTVYLNSIVNAVLSRCAFYELAPNNGFAYFRKYVSQITYGDDDIGSVSELCPWFTAVEKAKILKSYGLVYTPPSKSGDHIDYMKLEDVDFLKRKNVYIPEINKHLGALEESSIYKSLSHGIPSSFVTDEEVLGQVIDGALNELFAHGRDKYENFRCVALEFLNKHNLIRHSVSIDLDYDARIKRWRDNHCVE